MFGTLAVLLMLINQPLDRRLYPDVFLRRQFHCRYKIVGQFGFAGVGIKPILRDLRVFFVRPETATW